MWLKRWLFDLDNSNQFTNVAMSVFMQKRLLKNNKYCKRLRQTVLEIYCLQQERAIFKFVTAEI